MHLFLPLYLLPIVVAQQTLPTTTLPEFDYSLTMGSTPAETYRRTITLDVDGDSLQDVCVLRGVEVDMMAGPGLYEASLPDITTGGDVHDIAALEGWPLEGADALVTVGVDGAVALDFKWVFQGGGGNPVPTPLWSTTTLEGSTWVGAKLVRTRDVQDTSPRIYGVLSDGKTVNALIDSGSGYQDTGLFAVSETILELCPVEWDTTPECEVAVLTASGLEVFQYVSGAAGTQQTWQSVYVSHPTGFTGVALEAGVHDGEEWLAWIASWDNNPVKEVLVVTDINGYWASGFLPDDPQVVGIATGDWTGDGRDELALSSKYGYELAILYNLGEGSPAFDVVSSTGVEVLSLDGPAGPAPEIEAIPAFADFDNNLTLDWCMPLQATGQLRVGRSGPPANNGQFLKQIPMVETPYLDDPATCSTTYLNLPIVMPEELPEDANAIGCALFVKPNASSSTGAVSVATSRFLLAPFLEPPNPAQPGDTLTTLQLDIGQTTPFNEVYFWVQWPLKVNTQNNNVRQVFAPQVYGIQGQGNPWAGTVSNNEYLTGLNPVTPFELRKTCDPSQAIGVLIGSGVPLPCLPEIAEGEMPYVQH